MPRAKRTPLPPKPNKTGASPPEPHDYRLVGPLECRHERGPEARACKLCRRPIEVGEWYYVVCFPSRNIRVSHQSCVETYEIETGKTDAGPDEE